MLPPSSSSLLPGDGGLIILLESDIFLVIPGILRIPTSAAALLAGPSSA